MILILDFGSQYTQLIARRIRELNVYCEIHPYNIVDGSRFIVHSSEVSISKDIKGVIFSGGPDSVYEKNSPKINLAALNFFLDKKIPVLGICYGMQLITHLLKGKVVKGEIHEYGLVKIKFSDKSEIFSDVPEE
ncbi:MAG: gamma-glutamyl-gamma-aminobutyrate hydrolase family protein, partial [Endomicrobia bacterium]|nr:gamma-glutamyl-gamma-aminobutyrate hydrolase family protein [Endomicrobiia bacterium]